MMRGATVVSFVVLLLLPTLTQAGEPPVPIEGPMLVTSTAGTLFPEGSSDNATPCPLPGGPVIVQGCPDGYYRPQRLVARDQMAVYLARAFNLLD